MGRPVVITGGGTGGHLFPMMAVAEALKSFGVATSELHYVGSRRGQEAQLLGDGEVTLTLLPGRGIVRSVRPKALLDNLGALCGLLAAISAAIFLLIKWRPRAVVSVGGYAALAVDLAAVVTRTPLVLIEYDVVPGATHRLVGRFAWRRCTAFASPDPRAVVTGAPLRESITRIDRSAVKLVRGEMATGRWTVVVMTGSLGARSVNRAVVELANIWRDREDISLLHVTGRRDATALAGLWDPRLDDRLNYQQIPFADMETLWSVADIAICRAGALTVAELTYLGIPSVLVPLPGAPDDHQTKNARAVERCGGAIVLSDALCSAMALADLIDPLLAAPERLRAMADSARSLRHEDAAKAIAAVVLEAAR